MSEGRTGKSVGSPLTGLKTDSLEVSRPGRAKGGGGTSVCEINADVRDFSLWSGDGEGLVT